MSEPKKISRQQIYEMVWMKPIKTLAQEWNTTPVQVVRACEEIEVPRPGPGHWQMIARGYEIQREPLPEPARDVPSEVALVPLDKTIRVQRTKAQPASSDPIGSKESATAAPESAAVAAPPAVECNLPKAVERAVLDIIRQATKIDFWKDELSDFHFPSGLAHWFGVEAKIAESKLIKALKAVRNEFRTFDISVKEKPYRYDSAQSGWEIAICLRDGYEWKNAWEEAWSFAERPNDHCLSDNALLLYQWAKGPKNTGKVMERKKIGAQARLRRTYSDMDQHLEEIQLKADPSIRWEKAQNGWRAPLRIWFETEKRVYYHHGPLNPALGLDLRQIAHGELERLREWLYQEILKPEFPSGRTVVGLYDIRNRKTLKSVFSRLPESCGRYGDLPDFFKALRLEDGLELRFSFEDGGGPWLVVCLPQEGATWETIKARLKARAEEVPLEQKYELTAHSMALLRWIVELRGEEYLQGMTPVVENCLQQDIGIEGNWNEENWGSYLQVLVEEINEGTEFRLRTVPWHDRGKWHTRILVKKKRIDLDDLVRAVQAYCLNRGKALNLGTVKTAIGALVEA
jgi:hypothetical protein